VPHSKQPLAGPIQPSRNFEIIASAELARRYDVPLSWIQEGVRSRQTDPIPCLRLGRYVRFEWDSPELNAWLERHRHSGTLRRNVHKVSDAGAVTREVG
jgi:hypothetical protein